MRYSFEWDPNKAKKNLLKHKINFDRAAQVFLDPNAISIFDEEHSAEEDRWITIGKDNSEVLIVVIHTFREESTNDCTIRMISARKAIKKESKQYEDYHL